MDTSTTSAAAPATATAPAAATASTTSPASMAVSTSTPITPAAATPATPTTALTPDASVEAMVAAAKARGFADDSAATPAAAADAGATTETTPAATETKAADDNAAAAATQDTDGYTLDEDGFVGARDLAAKIEANPGLKAALPEDVRNEIMANARLAEVGAQYRDLFSSPAEAKIIHETAQQHAAYTEAFSMIGTDPAKGTTSFINKLIEASALRDADGKPMFYDDGKTIRTDGTANKFVEEIGKRFLNRSIVEKVKASGDEDAIAALDLVMERAGLRPSTADKTDQDPALAARKAELDAQEARIRQERETGQASARQEYTQALNGDLASLYDAEVGSLLGLATGLDGFTKTAVEQKLEKAIRTSIKANTAYQMRKNQIQQQPMSPQRRQAEVALAKEFFRNNLAKIARPILAEAGVAVKGKVEERKQAAAARVDSTRSEVSGGAASQPARPGAPQNPTQAIASAREAYKAQNGGREPSDSDLNVFMMLNHAKSKGYGA